MVFVMPTLRQMPVAHLFSFEACNFVQTVVRIRSVAGHKFAKSRHNSTALISAISRDFFIQKMQYAYRFDQANHPPPICAPVPSCFNLQLTSHLSKILIRFSCHYLGNHLSHFGLHLEGDFDNLEN